jgi:hypothetical protein
VDLLVVARAHTDLVRPLPDRPSHSHGKLRFDGSRGDVAAFRSWFALSMFAFGGPRVDHAGGGCSRANTGLHQSIRWDVLTPALAHDRRSDATWQSQVLYEQFRSLGLRLT